MMNKQILDDVIIYFVETNKYHKLYIGRKNKQYEIEIIMFKQINNVNLIPLKWGRLHGSHDAILFGP